MFLKFVGLHSCFRNSSHAPMFFFSFSLSFQFYFRFLFFFLLLRFLASSSPPLVPFPLLCCFLFSSSSSRVLSSSFCRFFFFFSVMVPLLLFPLCFIVSLLSFLCDFFLFLIHLYVPFLSVFFFFYHRHCCCFLSFCSMSFPVFFFLFLPLSLLCPISIMCVSPPWFGSVFVVVSAIVHGCSGCPAIGLAFLATGLAVAALMPCLLVWSLVQLLFSFARLLRLLFSHYPATPTIPTVARLLFSRCSAIPAALQPLSDHSDRSPATPTFVRLFRPVRLLFGRCRCSSSVFVSSQICQCQPCPTIFWSAISVRLSLFFTTG